MKPMLAATLGREELLRFPLLVSPKLDGVRALIINGVVMSRNMKPIPNQFVQSLWGGELFNGFDGELIVGEPTSPSCYRDTMSGVMTGFGNPDVFFYVFDDYEQADQTFCRRIENLRKRVAGGRIPSHIQDRTPVVEHVECFDMDDLNHCESQYLADGYEGAMVRATEGPYKNGRSTEREGWLVKVKRFADDEAVIIGFDEQMHNGNELTRDALGRAKRTSHKENKTEKGTLGALKVRGITGPYKDVEFDIGTGFSDLERQEIWDNSHAFVGKIVKFKYFPGGSKDKPRFPTSLGMRPEGA